MRTYDFYVGTVPFHNAHISMKALDAFPETMRDIVFDSRKRVYGVWEGVTEETAIFSAELASDEIAQRIAYAIAILTGNDCVLVIRPADEMAHEKSFNSTARYRVRREFRYAGNRTLLGDEIGYAFTRDVKGSHVAYLVNNDATLSHVS